MEKTTEANAGRWRNRFFSLWPYAAVAIESIVKRCTTMIHSFTTAHIASIEKALRNARSMEGRKKYAKDLWNMAKDEMPGITLKTWIQEGKKDLDLPGTESGNAPVTAQNSNYLNKDKTMLRDHSNQASFSFLHFAFSSK